MTRAGLNILDTLQMAKNQVNDKKLKIIIESITQDLHGGTDIAGSFKKHQKDFDNIYVNMIKAGEAGGKLDIFLDKLVGILEKEKKLNLKLKAH